MKRRMFLQEDQEKKPTGNEKVKLGAVNKGPLEPEETIESTEDWLKDQGDPLVFPCDHLDRDGRAYPGLEPTLILVFVCLFVVFFFLLSGATILALTMCESFKCGL